MGWIVAAALGIAVIVLIVLVVLYERELDRLARFLHKGDRGANERVTLDFSTPGISSLAAAMNKEMDALCDERASMHEQQETFQCNLAALSHDIRTPLAGAQGYLQLYERSEDPNEKAHCLREAAARLAAMRELTDALFDYATAVDQETPLELVPVELLPVLSSSLAGLYPQFAKRGWEPVIRFADEGVCVMADEDSLRRIFDNLLVNTLRHGTSAPTIIQSVLPARDEGEAPLLTVTFSNRVEDVGTIDAERLFDRFYRADGARSGGGSGLGLAIVSSLCERMGGSVEAHLIGDELAITVTLPAACRVASA